MKSVLDNPTLAELIKAKLKSVLDDVTGDGDKNLTLFGDPIIRTKLQSVLDDMYRDPNFSNVDRALAYSVLGDVYLEHFGVKGMHWGVRREERRSSKLAERGAQEVARRAERTPAPVHVHDTIGRSKSAKTKLKAVGGEDHPASEDAIKVATSRQKMKKSGIHTLTNTELQAMAQRMNLEAQVTSLNSRHKRITGQGFVDAHLARAQRDPFGTVMKTHKIAKRAPTAIKTVKRAAAIGAVAVAL